MDAIFQQTPHRRLNPLTGEHVLVSPHRLERPWQGKVEPVATADRPARDPKCYLCPGNERAGGARNPEYAGTFVFDNDYAALKNGVARSASNVGDLLVAEVETGICRVVCFSPRHDLTLAEMSAADIRRVVDVWAEETARLGSLPDIAYVQVFENKGAIMGCSNPHPHGQIWATASIPTEVAREDAFQAEHFRRTGRALLSDYLEIELREDARIVCRNSSWVALVPFWAKWPYETMILPRRRVSSLGELDAIERDGLADILRRQLCRYDNLFSTSFPYTMGLHQASSKGGHHPHWHLHFHVYPPLLRSATVQKFMVGFEMLCMAQRDITPETAAERLRGLQEIHFRGAQP